MTRGFLIVIDGIDGSGKTTQIKLLAKFLKAKKIPYEVISFPRYGNNKYTDQIESYLNGSIKPDPFTIAQAFAGDRLLARSQIEQWLNEGKLVIANRYVSASKAHLGANLPESERKDFFRWLDDLEYIKNGIPREDLTILLTVDPTAGQKNVKVHTRVDIHEENLKHLEEAAKIYLELAGENLNWVVVNCMKAGKMRPKEDINKECIQKLNSSSVRLQP